MKSELYAAAAGGHPTHLKLDVRRTGAVPFCRDAATGNTHRYVHDMDCGRLVLDFGLNDWSAAIWLDLTNDTSLLWDRATLVTLRDCVNWFGDRLLQMDRQSIISRVGVHDDCCDLCEP